jgi:membrane carboxypeptidase/penicillin-binding protein
MENVSGITGAAPIWHDYMEMASAGTPVEQFTAPSGIVTAKVCPSDGGLDTNPNDPNAVTEVFLAGTAPTKPCGSVNSGAAPLNLTPTPTQSQPVTPTTQTTAQAPAPSTPSGGLGGGTPTAPSDPGSGGTAPTNPPSGGKNPTP